MLFDVVWCPFLLQVSNFSIGWEAFLDDLMDCRLERGKVGMQLCNITWYLAKSVSRLGRCAFLKRMQTRLVLHTPSSLVKNAIFSTRRYKRWSAVLKTFYLQFPTIMINMLPINHILPPWGLPHGFVCHYYPFLSWGCSSTYNWIHNSFF